MITALAPRRALIGDDVTMGVELNHVVDYDAIKWMKDGSVLTEEMDRRLR